MKRVLAKKCFEILGNMCVLFFIGQNKNREAIECE